MNVAEYIFKFFSNKGINTTFTVKGTKAMELNEAVERNLKFQIVSTHHEQSAAMSADAYGRIQYKPAIALVSSGPGSVNALNGVIGGFTDSAPMIVISGQSALSFVQYQEETKIRQFGVQGINIKSIVENFVKYFITVDDPQKIQIYLEKAFEMATTGRMGPVWIDVPLDIQTTTVNERFLEKYQPQEQTEQEGRVSLKQAVKQAYKLIQQAKRPIFLVGQGVGLSGGRIEFQELINKLKIPVITSRLGIDLIESNHDLYVGRPGNYGEKSANLAIQEADLILSIGCRMASALVGENPKTFGKNAYIFAIDIDQKELDKPGVNISYKVNLDAKDFINKMLEKLSEQKLPSDEEWVSTCQQWKREYPVVLPKYAQEYPVNAYYFMDKLSKMTSKHTAVVVDTGTSFHVACQTWQVKKGQTFLTAGGLSSRGYWAAGIGACLANERKETIVITDEFSLQMNIQEFATIKHNKLPIKVVIFKHNLKLSLSQDNWCPDSIEIAKAYGIKYVSIDAVENLEEKIQEVLDDEGPVICEVRTTGEEKKGNMIVGR